jgi:hypothetical protein
MLSVPKPLVFTMFVAAQGGPPASMDGNALLSLCQVGNDEERVCMVYIEAVADECFLQTHTNRSAPLMPSALSCAMLY